MKKLIITENEKRNILEMYGLIKEDDNSGRCDSWKNGTFTQGDGITTPKITITKTPSLIEGLYEGPDKGGCIQRREFLDTDTPHQLAGITIYYEAAPYLKQLYKQGTYVKPDKKNIKMERVPNKSFKISIPLIPTTEDQAITNINERGGMGHEGDLQEIQDIRANPNHILVDSVRIKSKDLIETIIWFRNKEKFPIKTVSQNQTNSNTDIDSQTETGEKNKKIISYSNLDPLDLRQKLKDFSQTTELYNVDLSINKDDQNVIIEYDTQGDERNYLSYIFSNSGEEHKVLEKVKEKNNVVNNLILNIPGYFGWVVQMT